MIVPTTSAMTPSTCPITCRIGAIACNTGAISPSSCAIGGRIAMQITLRICMIGGSSVCANSDMTLISGGSTVCATMDMIGISGCITVKIMLSASDSTGNRVMPSSIRMGPPSANPLASTSTNCISMSSIVGQADRIVLNSSVKTGVNFAPAPAIKSCHMPFTPFRPLV